MEPKGFDGVILSSYIPEPLIVSEKYRGIVTASEIYEWVDFLYDETLLQTAKLPAWSSHYQDFLHIPSN